MVLRNILGLSCLLLTVYSIPTSKTILTADADYRLPTTVVPSKYTIALTFPEEAFKDGTTFTGSVTIDFLVKSDITEIKLHVSHDYITIDTLKVAEKEVAKTDYTVDAATDILTIPTTGLDIKEGTSYTMVITYTGKISTDDKYGIFKTSYTNKDKKTVYLLATQFEPTYARRAFPCFDEPAFKATFDVTVNYPSTQGQVLFNTEQTKVPDVADNVATVIFKTTPVMSSYLVALVVSDFTGSPAVTIDGDTSVQFRVWSRDEVSASRAYAQEVGPLVLQKLNEYTGLSYGKDMTKLDLVALPDLGVGAMENWGLVTFREWTLLWNADDSSSAPKEVTLTHVAHEIAHQWFGNVITCYWWSQTFLNEGFATYFAYLIANQVQPTWQHDQQFVVDILHKVLESDAAEDAQALQSDVYTPEQVQDKFGSTSYNKGGSIIRMLAHIMGEENFKAGIQEYFQTASLVHSTSTPAKLWELLQKHNVAADSGLTDVTIATVMQNWVEKSGYPLLTVTLDGKKLKISQERFLLTEQGDKTTKWYVPVTLVESASISETKFQATNPLAWLTPDVPEITIEFENDNSWVLLNPSQTGYYRVNYDSNLWTNIAAALLKENFDGIVELNRAQIVDDLFSLAQANKLTYTDFLNTTDFLRNDDSYYSWNSAFRGFDFMIQRIPENTELRTLMQAQLLLLTEALYKSVSFEEIKEDDQISTLKQALALSKACALGREDCITKATAAFSDYKKSTTKTKPNKNLRSLIYCTALKNSQDDTDYEFLWKEYLETEVATERNTILKALGCSVNEVKLKELLTETIKTDSKVNDQDSLTGFATVYGGSSTGAGVALQFFQDNMAAILTKYPSLSTEKTLISGIAGKLTTDDQVQKLKTLVAAEGFPAALKDEGNKAVAQGELNVKWFTDHQADLEKFFKGDDTTTQKTDATTQKTNPTTQKTDPTTQKTDPTTQKTDPTTQKTDPTTQKTDPTTQKPDGANAVHMNIIILTIVCIVPILGFLTM